ncbi:hypothetical protein ES703_08864 [subsurface metagenome]
MKSWGGQKEREKGKAISGREGLDGSRAPLPSIKLIGGKYAN